MQITTTQVRQKYPKLSRLRLQYANRRGLKFKKRIIDGRAVNVYVEKDVLRFFGIKENSRKNSRA